LRRVTQVAGRGVFANEKLNRHSFAFIILVVKVKY